MTKSATDVMQDIIFSAAIDTIVALKSASKGMPNTLLRDLNAIHANTTLPDLPEELQATINASVRAAFTRLLKEGYSVSSGQITPARGAPPKRETAGPHPATSRVRRSETDASKAPRKGGRGDRKPKPRGN